MDAQSERQRARQSANLMDAIIELDFADRVPRPRRTAPGPGRRTNFSGPFSSALDYPGSFGVGATGEFLRTAEGPSGRNDGAVIWGASRRASSSTTRHDESIAREFGQSPLFSGRLTSRRSARNPVLQLEPTTARRTCSPSGWARSTAQTAARGVVHSVHPRRRLRRWRLRPRPRGPRGATSRQFLRGERPACWRLQPWVRSSDRSPARGLLYIGPATTQTDQQHVSSFAAPGIDKAQARAPRLGRPAARAKDEMCCRLVVAAPCDSKPPRR